ncbi:protein translocase subunit SecD [Candidatus Cyanaurora vandensis]|uniref:protein translocase subunit SecD n=1 Tax=Candidatus Cyanaurora vandensis TaxID=2714958 RepID=UPI00257EA8E6|nr:protein translocase subunit SecD [Candidatus Cyanaurora vandensis]
MKQRYWLILLLVVVLTAGSIYTILNRPISKGLDLVGGTQLTLEAQPTAEVKEITPEVLQGVKTVLEQRINALGTKEPLIQVRGKNQIVVQLPEEKDPERAIRLLGDTAQLEFKEEVPSSGIGNADNGWKSTGLTGKELKDARQQINQSGEWEVALEFSDKGGQLFAQLTGALGGTGRRLGVFLDDKLVTTPTVGPEFAGVGITGGKAVITGAGTVEEATDLAIKLRAGALPVPIKVVENRTVGASLGQDSVDSSLRAGIAGVIAVGIFMLLYYRLQGLVADLALIVYALLNLALFAWVGVTLTLPGIAGFILSIGLAVDANVLIAERTKEELNAGKKLYSAVDAGFDRAFASILDGHVTNLIACAVLFWLGTGLVRGFAVTLAIGVAMSLFTAVTCSRVFLLLLLKVPPLRNPWLLGAKAPAKSA